MTNAISLTKSERMELTKQATSRLADYRIWGRTVYVHGEGYLAIASAVREDLDPSGTHVLSEIQLTRPAAERALREFMTKLGEDIRRGGGRIADVETDSI